MASLIIGTTGKEVQTSTETMIACTVRSSNGPSGLVRWRLELHRTDGEVIWEVWEDSRYLVNVRSFPVDAVSMEEAWSLGVVALAHLAGQVEIHISSFKLEGR